MHALKIFAICFTLTACSNNPTPTTTVESEALDSIIQNIETPPNKSFNTNSKLPENYEAPFVSIDSFYPQEQLIDLLASWNKAINQKDVSALSSLYAPHITYYTKKLSKEKLLIKKKKHFEKSPDYQQEVRIVDIEYPRNEANVIRCSFLKSFDRNGKQDTVLSLIEFDSKQEPLLIIKESDKISEWQKAKRMPTTMDFPKGKHYFEYDYWQDNRNNNVTAWDFINRSHSLFIDNSTTEIELSFSTNYGPGSHYRYFIKNAQIVAGIISFEGAGMGISTHDDWMERIEEGDVIPANWFKKYQFKILDFHTVVELDKGSATYYHRGRYTRPKEDS